ncbi:2-oxoglutarate dehydrogenase, E2 component, dihydrolipoamide succinyltransferase [Nocardioides euryhalodurans]|uniref:Dihydrolipoamide acetyltransferase component of pyruvate dehydrogenase complex n=1 Tax=Nocardioides euryhalodurans TaxID=2518370 RepID=A0A4P7GHS9_9ACTN|nr:2-oxoglutarate dehydrogenase, E2 component, dihydrolipoamide succinyltransferase [Nocardioides euryhalodurans]QBR91468.1 2-oxoglutarate dehydrogenase, E2 component, dihydrolipoamide succinyltransferase [Nocardioides euryhalodurans]
MATEVTLPALGESVTEGTVTRWLKQVGDTISVDEPLLEVSTDKVDTEIPSPVAGTLLEIKANEDDTVEVGAVLALVGDEGESGGDSGSEDSGQDEQEESGDETEESGGGGEDLEQERAEAEAEEKDSSGEAPSEQEPADDHPSSDDSSGGSGSGGGSGTSVTLPALGESVTEGTVTRWLKQVGDEVAVDEPLLEVSTDKVDTEIPSPVAGTLLEVKVAEDETVEVGAELAVIGSGDAGGDAPAQAEPEAQPADEEQAEKKAEQEQEIAEEKGDLPAGDETPESEKDEPEPEKEPEPAKQPEPAAQEPPAPAKDREEPSTYVTPLVRKMAAQHDVDLASVTGTGVGGRIRKQDVLDAAEKAKQAAAPAEAPAAAAPAASTPAPASPSPLRGKTEPMSRLRKIIASRMVESLHGSAQLTQVMEVDVTRIARMREGAKADFLAREGVKLTYLPFFAKAAIDALKQHPALNATIDTEAGEVTYYDREHVAFAVDTDKGLLTPVVKDAGDLSIAGLAKKIADVAERTRTNKIGPDELSGGTFTITNLGSFGALFDTPIINKPQVAILGPGAVVKRPVVIDDPNLGETIAVRHMVYLSLTYDHRLVDGADAGRFLREVKQRLESGQFEV